jgi:hypothetical protein
LAKFTKVNAHPIRLRNTDRTFGSILALQDDNQQNQQSYKKKYPAMRPYNLFVGKQQANYGLKFAGGSIVKANGGDRR